MPYYKRRRRYRPRRRRYGPSRVFKQNVKKAMVDMSSKYRDTANIDVTIFETNVASATTSQNEYTAIPAGTNRDERDGQTIFGRSLQLNMKFTKTSAGADEQIRILLVYYEGDSAPQISAILDKVSVDDWFMALYRTAEESLFQHNYKVLVDRKITLSGGVSNDVHVPLMVKLNRHRTTYSSNLATSAEKGRLSLFLISDKTTTQVSNVTAKILSRFKFSDSV